MLVFSGGSELFREVHKPIKCLFQISEALESDDENDEQEVAPSVDATYDHPEHVVTVTTVSDVNLDSGKFACIGPNKVSDTYLTPLC